MRAWLSTACAYAFAGAAVMTASSAMAATNLIQDGTSNTLVIGEQGTLRPNSGWDAGSTPSDPKTVYDGVFVTPETQPLNQWNAKSFWWDQDVNGDNYNLVSLTLDLKHTYKFTSFSVQADNNDGYLLQYWDGSAWQTAWNIPTIGGWGLTTRNSQLLPAIETDALRISHDPNGGGDGYYAVSELQGFGVEVPEPATWALMLLGVGAVGAAMRSQRKALATA